MAEKKEWTMSPLEARVAFVGMMDETEDWARAIWRHNPQFLDFYKTSRLANIEDHLYDYDKWDSVRTFPGTVEFVLPGLNKGVGLRRYAERNGIPVGEILAIGDMDNDTAMIEAAGWGVCMANGCDASKAVADAVTEYGVDEDGFGRYFEDHWFNR